MAFANVIVNDKVFSLLDSHVQSILCSGLYQSPCSLVARVFDFCCYFPSLTLVSKCCRAAASAELINAGRNPVSLC